MENNKEICATIYHDEDVATRIVFSESFEEVVVIVVKFTQAFAALCLVSVTAPPDVFCMVSAFNVLMLSPSSR